MENIQICLILHLKLPFWHFLLLMIQSVSEINMLLVWNSLILRMLLNVLVWFTKKALPFFLFFKICNWLILLPLYTICTFFYLQNMRTGKQYTNLKKYIFSVIIFCTHQWRLHHIAFISDLKQENKYQKKIKKLSKQCYKINIYTKIR
jgi:hypothetical protein